MYRYARYSCICADSLIRNGGVRPDQIHVWLGENMDTEPARVLERMGCVLMPEVSGKTKLGMLSKTFHVDAPPCTLLFDADMIVQPGVNIPDLVNRYRDAFVVVHPTGVPYIPAFYDRLENWVKPHPLLLEMLGMTIEKIADMNKNEEWHWGSFYLVNQRTRGTRFWELMTLGNEWCCLDDELLQSIFRWIDPGKLHVMKNDVMQVFASKLPEQLNMKGCFLHYAGNELKDKFDALINTIYREVVARVLYGGAETRLFL